MARIRGLCLALFALPFSAALAQPIANGTYTLAPANATAQRLDVSASGTADGSNVQVWQLNGQINQHWIFTNTGGSTYRLSPAHATSKCLDVSVLSNPPSGTNVHIWEYFGNANQKWTVAAVSGGYTLTPTNATGLRLNNTGTANGANVNVTTNSSSTAQRWSIVAVGGGTPPLANGNYTLAPANATSKRLDVSNAGTADGTNVQIWASAGVPQQQWTLTNISGNVYRLSPVHAPAQCLDVSGQGTASGTNVQTWQYLSQTNQRWALTAVSGGYTLTPQHATGLRLNATGTGDGANVNVTTANGSTAQTWSFAAVAPSAPPAPNLTSATAGNGQVSLVWNASSGATSYTVYRSTSANNANPTQVQTNITTTSYTNTGLTNGTTYYFKVRAVNSVGSSGFSNERSATPTSTLGAPDPGIAYVPSGLSLTFSDEFNGTSLDTGKWNSQFPYEQVGEPDGLECYEAAGVIVANGLCNLRASKQTTSCGPSQPWRSGVITTNSTFVHGYFEARIRVHQGKGLWPAFWLTGAATWPPEWDIMEIPNTTGTLYQFLHLVSGATQSWVGGAEGSDSTYTMGEGMPNPYTGYVIYGCQWTSSFVKFWVNGVLTAHWNISGGANSNTPMWIVLNLAVGGSWPGLPDSTTPNPSNMYIDYVRVYQ